MFSVQADQPPIWTLGSDHYLHFPIASPKSNEFLLWSISVSSDNEDEDWVADSEFRDWVVLKTSNDLVNISINNMEIDLTKNEENFSNFDDYLFSITHKTFEFTSLEQLLRLQQQMQQRRPLVLDSLRRSQQGGGSFMWMFKSEHSPSPPPALPFTSSKFSINNRQTTTTSYSSFAAGTASILRKEEIKEKIKNKKSFVDEEGQKPLLLFDENEIAEEADEQKVEDQSEGVDDNFGGIEGGGGTLLLMTLDKQNENKQNLIGNSKEEGLAIFSAVEAEERTFESDVIILEDKNAPEELANDPLNKFRGANTYICFELILGRALLNHQITQTPKIQQKQPFGINTGLKSPREVYFGIKNGRKSVCGGYRGILGISDVDMALYSKYSMAASSVFERHNLRRQKQPTAWKLPNPLKNLHKMPSSTSTPPSQQLKFSPLVNSSTRSAPTKQQQQQQQRKYSQKHSSSISSNHSSPTNIKYSQPQTSPFRKDFYRLGPAFEFKPSNFSKNNSFSVELEPISDESMLIYKKIFEENYLKETLKTV
uniref:Uncharacterized protein n=1 Tax=Meloidogyne floridensis TaxID=298350 RepID=A0A915NXR7_9BILA